MQTKRILVVGPLPPPHTGNSLPVQMLVNHWKDQGHIVHAISFSSSKLISGNFSFEKLMIWSKIYIHFLLHKNKYDLVYLSIAESFFGNIRDLLFYFILGHTRGKLTIHLLGGNSFQNILQSPNFIGKINRYYLSKLKSIIVESEHQKSFFNKYDVIHSKVSIIENFAEDGLFSSYSEISQKFTAPPTLKLLFLSNLLYGKGHIELLEAYLSLPDFIKNKFELHFAGNLVYDPSNNFLEKVQSQPNVFFHGFINGNQKKQLFKEAHIFCLPTYYPFEGLPFSIIEAYASGCIAILTEHSGIPYIFKNQKNGFVVEKMKVNSIVDSLKLVYDYSENNMQYLIDIAFHNYNQALERNKLSHYLKSFDQIFIN